MKLWLRIKFKIAEKRILRFHNAKLSKENEELKKHVAKLERMNRLYFNRNIDLRLENRGLEKIINKLKAERLTVEDVNTGT